MHLLLLTMHQFLEMSLHTYIRDGYRNVFMTTESVPRMQEPIVSCQYRFLRTFPSF